MLRFIFLRVVLPLLLFLLLRYLIKAISGSMKSAPDSAKQTRAAKTGGELKQDPVCGTFVAREAAVTREVGGEVFHFCSIACRDRYRS